MNKNILTNIPEFILHGIYEGITLQDVGNNSGNIAFWEATKKILLNYGFKLWSIQSGFPPVQIHAIVFVLANSIGPNQTDVNYLNYLDNFARRYDYRNFVILSIGAQSNDYSIISLKENMISRLTQWDSLAKVIFVRGDYTKQLLDHYHINKSIISLGCPSFTYTPINFDSIISKYDNLLNTSKMAITFPYFGNTKYFKLAIKLVKFSGM